MAVTGLRQPTRQSATALTYSATPACLTNSAPGYNGSSTGYYPGGSCGAQTKDVQEATLGYWYDFYRGDYGRVRLGMQYAYALREAGRAQRFPPTAPAASPPKV